VNDPWILFIAFFVRTTPLPGDGGCCLRRVSAQVCHILVLFIATVHVSYTGSKFIHKPSGSKCVLSACILLLGPVTVAEWSKARTAFARSDAGIVGSNSTQGMDVWCMCLFCVCVVLCLGRGLATS
jgi:hypothetical protein